MGTLGLMGREAAPHAIKVAAQHGIGLDGHRSQALNPAILRSATHIFAMERAHLHPLLSRGAPEERVHLLGRWDPAGDEEIDDPVDQPLEVFEACFARLDRAIGAFIEEQQALR